MSSRVLAALTCVVVCIASLLAPTSASAQSVAASQKSWDRSFASLQKRLSGPASISVTGLGRRADTFHVGFTDWVSAWSTIKIPLSMAALRRSKSATTRDRVNRALRHSDNGAAAQLWGELGSGRTAAHRVDLVLVAYGATRTRTQWRVVRKGASSFGQTRWSSIEQSAFMAGIACKQEGSYIRQQLQAATSGYWGLRRLEKAFVKNGYGPSNTGALVRQTAIVVARDGRRWGVSISVKAPSTNRGFSDASTITEWLRNRIGQVPAKRC